VYYYFTSFLDYSLFSKPTLDGNFDYTNVLLKDQITFLEINGELLNLSGKDFNVSYFKLNFYDSSGRLLTTGKISITGFKKNQKRSFQCFLDYQKVSEISNFTIDFESSD
ncbi:MAG: hypothetical protein EBS19_02580, partial [Spirochaetia bacterium]|nr:hypothetical protein [Spirochaetia bacterium]